MYDRRRVALHHRCISLRPLVVLLLGTALTVLPEALSSVQAQLTSPSTALRPSSGVPTSFKPFGPFRGYTGADSILLKDLATGAELYAYHADRRVSPASLTKILSSLVLLEYGHLEDHVVVSRQAASARRTRLGLRTGQVYRLEDLVKAMLITSANDACLAAVEHLGGTEAGFVSLMNGRARELGLQDSHFSNACGFDAPDHYSTAADLAKLTEAALRHPLFRTYVREEIEIITALNANRSFVLRNTNRLLGRLPGVEGVKTGFTSRAGRCVIIKVAQGGKELLLVLLNARQRWTTASRLINYGLQVPDVTMVEVRR